MCVLGNYYMTAENPTVSDLRDERLWEPLGFVSNMTASGVRVTPENSLGLAAYYDGIRIIAEDLAKLSLKTYRRIPRGKEEARDHPVFPLLRRAPNENMTAMAFRESIVANAISWGGGYALIQRNGRGVPQRLDLVHPTRVKVDTDRAGRTFYEVAIERDKTSIRTAIVRQPDMFHVHGLSADGINGYSVARVGAESIGRALAQDRFSSSFFKSGSSPKGAIRFAKKFRDQEEIDRLRFQWQETYGGDRGWHKPIILEQGAEWQTITIPPEEAQMIESQNFSVLEICRWLRLAPHKLGHLADATFSNVEEMNIDHVNDSLMPWGVRVEQECTRKLFIGEEDEFFAKHNYKTLLRGNTEQQTTFFREMFNVGALSQNDIREESDLNPIGPEGDTYYVQGNLMRSEDAAEGSTNASEDPPAGRSDGFDNAENPPPPPNAQFEAFVRMVRSALAPCDRKESLAEKNAIRKHGEPGTIALHQWAISFREKHKKYVMESVSEIVLAICDLVGASYVPEDVDVFAQEYVNAMNDDRGDRVRALVKTIAERGKS